MAGKRDLFINGQWVAAKSKATFPVYNPSTGEVWSNVADASRGDAAAAIEAAAAAQPAWAALPHSERARLLSKVADVLTARQKEFQETLVDEGGSWIGKTMFETGYGIGVYPSRRRRRLSGERRDPAVRPRQAEPRHAPAARRRCR